MLQDHEGPREDVFDPKTHLAYVAPKKRFTLNELKLPSTEASTCIAATEPFPMLSSEGVRAYRRSLFASNMLRRCACSPYPGTLILRNAAEHSTFINDFWTHPATMQIVGDAAGVKLSVVMRTEIGHTNIQTAGNTIEDMIAELTVEPDVTRLPLTEEERAYDPLASSSIIPWHYDSYPYVCVLMLSDTDGMVGGETYIKGGDGVPAKVEGPALGYGVMLQGGEVQHLATRGLGRKERISTITSYCADVPGVYDSSYISNIRPYSDINVLYKQWTLYRLRKMKSEIESLENHITQSESVVDVGKVHGFAEKQIQYLKRTARQLIPYDEYEALHRKFGKTNIYRASKLWRDAEQLPMFAEWTSSVDQFTWMQESPLWYDLARSQVDVRADRMLQAQTGRYQWSKPRPFLMGDELLRQGLPELFLSWLDATGLYSLVALP